MNELITAPQRSVLHPMERMQLARELATSRLIPPAFQKSPADIWLVMDVCDRFNLNFFLSVWECFLVHGRLGWTGKMAAAMLNNSGMLAELLSYSYAGAGDERTITVSARLASETTPRTVDVTLKDVRTGNEQWKKQPDQQLAYSGARKWGRLHLPQVMLGTIFEGEVIDVTPTSVVTHAPGDRTTQAIQGATEEIKAREPMQQPAPAQRRAPEAMPLPEEVVGEGGVLMRNWRPWAQELVAQIRAAETYSDMFEWREMNNAGLVLMGSEQPKMHKLLTASITEHIQQQQQREEQLDGEHAQRNVP